MTKNDNNNYSKASDDSSSCSDAEVDMYREISFPPNGAVGDLTYKIHMDVPDFNIINNYFTAIPGMYDINLPNAITVANTSVNRTVVFTIRIPRQTLQCKYGFDIPVDTVQDQYFTNPRISLMVKSSNRINTFISGDPEILQLINNQIPAYVEIIFAFLPQFGDTYVDVCSFSYSISFDAFKLKTLYIDCCEHKHKRKHKCRHPDDRIKLNIETVLQLSTNRLF